MNINVIKYSNKVIAFHGTITSIAFLNKISVLDDDVIVYPAHGAGSACGKNMMKITFDTLGNQKKLNYALNGSCNREEFIDILTKAKTLTGKGKPVAIILHTEMGNGVDFMMGTHKWHGSAPNDEQLDEALSQNPVTLGDY